MKGFFFSFFEITQNCKQPTTPTICLPSLCCLFNWHKSPRNFLHLGFLLALLFKFALRLLTLILFLLFFHYWIWYIMKPIAIIRKYTDTISPIQKCKPLCSYMLVSLFIRLKTLVLSHMPTLLPDFFLKVRVNHLAKNLRTPDPRRFKGHWRLTVWVFPRPIAKPL